MITPEQLAASGTEHGNQVALFAYAAVAARYGCCVADAWTSGEGLDAASSRFANDIPIKQLSLMFAIPNGGLRHKAVAGKLKAEGVKSGVPDIMLPVPRYDGLHNANNVKGYHGLFIEMKKPSEKPKRENSMGGVNWKQSDFHTALLNQGYQVAVCYSWQEARDVILAYLGVSQ